MERTRWECVCVWVQNWYRFYGRIVWHGVGMMLFAATMDGGWRRASTAHQMLLFIFAVAYFSFAFAIFDFSASIDTLYRTHNRYYDYCCVPGYAVLFYVTMVYCLAHNATVHSLTWSGSLRVFVCVRAHIGDLIDYVWCLISVHHAVDMSFHLLCQQFARNRNGIAYE